MFVGVVCMLAVVIFAGRSLTVVGGIDNEREDAGLYPVLSWTGHGKDKKALKASDEQVLRQELQELEARMDELERARRSMPRPPLTTTHHVLEAMEGQHAVEKARTDSKPVPGDADDHEQKSAQHKINPAVLGTDKAAAHGALAASTQTLGPGHSPEAKEGEHLPPRQDLEKADSHATNNPPATESAAAYDSDTSPVPLVDPTVLGRDPPALDHADMPGLCAHKSDGDEDVLRRIDVWPSAEKGKPRILCFSYTLSTAHAGPVQNLRRTWAQRCDGYVAFSNQTDPLIPSVDLKHKGPEAYANMWQKLRAAWIYLHKHHLQDYDYFLAGGDDIFVVVENLRRYLLSPEILAATKEGTEPIFLGRPFRPPGSDIAFNSGGAGFVLNAPALDVLGKELLGHGKKKRLCRPNQVGFWEDVNVAFCLHEGGVHVYNGTQDAHGRERFLPFKPGHHLRYRVPPKPDWYAVYTKEWGLKTGLDCCSTEAITFHYVKGDDMKRYHAIVHGMCPNIKASEGEVAQRAVDARR